MVETLALTRMQPAPSQLHGRLHSLDTKLNKTSKKSKKVSRYFIPSLLFLFIYFFKWCTATKCLRSVQLLGQQRLERKLNTTSEVQRTSRLDCYMVISEDELFFSGHHPAKGFETFDQITHRKWKWDFVKCTIGETEWSWSWVQNM